MSELQLREHPHFRGDYMGFTYNNVHSSNLGIVRVSDGSRFNENLLPTIQDKTVQVPGGDGTYYFGSYYTQRQFTINYAFEDLTEEEVKTLKSHFGDKKIHDLIFDERSDRIYSAKVTGTATIKYIPFDSDAGTIYKGEGSIQFTCYFPFARARNVSAGKNNGDMPVSFRMPISGQSGSIDLGSISWQNFPTQSQGLESQGVLDTSVGIITEEIMVGFDEDGNTIWTPTGKILNRYVTGDLTVKIPVGQEGPQGAVFTELYY